MQKRALFSESALIIPGHGSLKNDQSSLATRNLADDIGERGIFAEVHAVFWKEEPHYRETYKMISSPNVFVVPHFISEGYFTREVIPRELELEGKMTQRDGCRIRYCDPVGSHRGMTDLLLRRAREMVDGLDPAEVSILVLGHGTERNKNSAKAVRDQVEKIQHGADGYGEVLGVYLDESPRLSEWQDATRCKHVVVLPYFIAEGLHFSRDLPSMLGVENGATGQVYEIGSRVVHCATPVGADPAMADFVLDQVEGFEGDRAG